MSMDLFDAAASRQARNNALRIVADRAPTFVDKGLAAIAKLGPWTYTGEAIREQLTAQGIIPHHPNAWGALINLAIKRGLLVDTGRTEHMVAVKSHYRKTAVYEKR